MVKKTKVSKKKPIKKKDLVFIPVDYNNYKQNKKNILLSQIKLLECARTIEKIKGLNKEKEHLKLEFYRRLSEALALYHKTQSLLPVVEESNPVVKKNEKKLEVSVKYQDSESSVSFTKSVSQMDELDLELKEIQDKLNSLNSSRNF